MWDGLHSGQWKKIMKKKKKIPTIFIFFDFGFPPSATTLFIFKYVFLYFIWGPSLLSYSLPLSLSHIQSTKKRKRQAFVFTLLL